MNGEGVFAVHRGVFKHPMFADEAYTEREAWIWLCGNAVWKPCRVRVGRCLISLERGQLAYSERFLASTWKWSKSRARRYLQRLQNDEMIALKTDQGANQITICNYESYAFDGTSKRTGSGPEADRKRTKEEEGNKERRKEEERKEPGKKLLPDDWSIKLSHYEIGLKKNLTRSEVEEAAAEMRAWSIGNGQKRANWDYVFNNWLSRNAERKGTRNGYGGSRPLQNAGYGNPDKSVVAASDRLIERLRALDDPAPGELRGGEGQASLRLISKG